MILGTIITLRTDEETKRLFQQAALERHQTLTSFLLEAARRAAQEPAEEPPAAHTGIPTWFRALCAEASSGGSASYSWVAYELVRHIGDGSEAPYDVDAKAWSSEVERLNELIYQLQHRTKGKGHEFDHQREDRLWEWFAEHYPRMMSLIPSRRRPQFVLGIVKAWQDSLLEG